MSGIEDLLGKIKGYGSDVSDSSVGRMASGLGSFMLDTGASMVSPAYKEGLIGQQVMERDEQRRLRGKQYSDELWGQAAHVRDPLGATQAGPPDEVAGTGYAGGQMGIEDYLQRQQSNPNKAIGLAASGMMRDQFAPRKKLQPKTFVGGVKGGRGNQRQNHQLMEDGTTRPVGPSYETGANSTNIYNNAGDTAYSKGMGKGYADRHLATLDKADSDASMAREYRTIAGLSEGLYTGTGGSAVQSIRKLGDSLGFALPDFIDSTPKGASARAELVASLSNQLALKLRGAKDGGLTGSTSDKDLEFLIASVPTLLNTKGGLAFLAEAMENRARLSSDIANYTNSLGDYNARTSGLVNKRFANRSILPQGDYLETLMAQEDEVMNPTAPEQPTATGLTEAEEARFQELNKRFGGNND